MTVLHLKNEEWSCARETAVKAAQLEPLCPTILLRASACFGQEKDFVQAHAYYERALSLLPVSERVAYIAKLARLKEQSDDVKANVFREDPLDIFPLEVIINIMQFGLDTGDGDFVLKCSWVNRRWRDVLVNSCSELWKTLTFTHSGLTKKIWDDKTSAWVARAGKIDTIALNDFSLGAADRITKKQGKYLADARTLEIHARDRAVITRVARALSTFERGIHHLRIGQNSSWVRSRVREAGSLTEISCGMLPDEESRIQVQSIELQSVSFTCNPQGYGWTWMGGRRVLDRWQPVQDYPELRRLVVKGCSFDNIREDSQAGSTGSLKYQRDVLHTALRGCPNLEYLEVSYIGGYNSNVYQPGQAKRITMPLLKTAILPLPSQWSIDINAPNLESLAFSVSSINTWEYDRKHPERQRPLIPSIEDSPVEMDALLKLKSFEIACYTRDGIAEFGNWASRLDNITRLAIRHVGEAYPRASPPAQNSEGSSAAQVPDTEDRVSTRAVQFLLANVGSWFSKVTDLEFEACLIPGKTLVEYVRRRKLTAGCEALQHLTLVRCSKLSDKAKLVLEQEVPHFTITREATHHQKEMMAQYMDDSFDEEVCVKEEEATVKEE